MFFYFTAKIKPMLRLLAAAISSVLSTSTTNLSLNDLKEYSSTYGSKY